MVFDYLLAQGEKEMFVAAELIRPLEAVGASSQSNSNDFAENDKVEVLYKGTPFLIISVYSMGQ